jgi:hypothetical protein
MSNLLLAITLTAAVPLFEVHSVDGETIVGRIVELDTERITIDYADGHLSLDTDKIMQVSAGEMPTPLDHVPCAWIDLVDGSSLVARQITSCDGRAQITLADGHDVELPTAGITSVQFQAQTDLIASQWSRILDLKLDSDLLIVRNGETLDYHKGVLRDVTERIVHFEFDSDLLPVKRSKVHGLIFCHPPVGYRRGTLPKTVCRITDASGSQWSVCSLAFGQSTSPGELQWSTPGGLTVSRPLALVTRIDFSSGKIVYLSDLKPESVTFTPCFGPARWRRRSSGGRGPLADFFTPRRDKNLESGPLQLGGTQYAKGLALHSRTKVVYRLPGRFHRFKATVGIDDGVRPHGNVRLAIYGDEKLLLESTVTGTDPPRPIDLDLTGIRRISILADFGDQLDVADHLDLCNARIIK